MSAAEGALRSLTGAWRLFLNRPDGMRSFDMTVEGFWRSFGAVAFVAPIFAVGFLAEDQRTLPLADAAAGSTYFIGRAIALAVDWVALPIILFLAAKPLGITRSYPAYVIARNWSAVIASVPFGVVALLYLWGFLGDQVSAVLTLAALAVVVRYNFIVARTALGAGTGFAAGLVAFDFLLSLLIAEGVGRAFGVPPGS